MDEPESPELERADLADRLFAMAEQLDELKRVELVHIVQARLRALARGVRDGRPLTELPDWRPANDLPEDSRRRRQRPAD